MGIEPGAGTWNGTPDSQGTADRIDHFYAPFRPNNLAEPWEIADARPSCSLTAVGREAREGGQFISAGQLRQREGPRLKRNPAGTSVRPVWGGEGKRDYGEWRAVRFCASGDGANKCQIASVLLMHHVVLGGRPNADRGDGTLLRSLGQVAIT